METQSLLQSLFDRSVAGIRGQGYATSGGPSMCLYRGPAGLKCAVGHLIPDTAYREKMEGKDVHSLSMWFPELKPVLGLDEEGAFSLLMWLQKIHDSVAALELPTTEAKRWFECEWEALASAFNLTYTAP